MNRTKAQLSDRKWNSFYEALRLYATNHKMNNYNFQYLKSLERPVMHIKINNKGINAK